MMKEQKSIDREEKVNVWTHVAGLVLGLALIPVLFTKAWEGGTNLMLFSLGVFSFGFLMIYLSSSLYHLAKKPHVKKRLQVWDHISIFVMIGGTYTPVVFHYLHFDTAAIFMGVMWSIIVVGSLLKIFFTGRYERASTFIYLALSWMIVFIIKPILQVMPMEVLAWIMVGGFFYTSGVIFFNWEKLKYNHGIWHLFVLGGTLAHFVAIYKIVG